MCNGHRHCTKGPVYVVTIHRIDYCRRPFGPEGHYRLCPACTAAVAYRMGQVIGEMYEAMPEEIAGRVLECASCGRWINDLSDVFDVEWIKAATA